MLQGGAAELNLKYLLWVVKLYSTDGPYWFVPNLLIALALMLVLRRFLKDIRIGLVFLLASLFYSVNIYGHWITVVHTHAVFGFVFYLWLGAWGAWHFQELQKWLARIPAGVMFGAVILALCLTSAETTLLVRLGSVDPANTLRITNQICSVVTVLAFLKLKGAVWPDFVHVREHTFGVYLVHTVAISFFVRVVGPVFQFLAASPRWVLCAGSMVMLPALFAMVYGGSLVVVRTLLAYPKLRWMVGLPQRKAAKSKVPQIEVSKRAPSLRPHHQGRQFVVVNKT